LGQGKADQCAKSVTYSAFYTHLLEATRIWWNKVLQQKPCSTLAPRERLSKEISGSSYGKVS